MNTILEKEDIFRCVRAMSVAKGYLSDDPDNDAAVEELDSAIEMLIKKIGNAEQKTITGDDEIARYENALSGSEAIFGFCSWLTCREGTLKFGAKHSPSPACDLIKLFCKTNSISDPRDNYTDFLTHPIET